MGKKTAKRLWAGAVSLFFLVLSLVALGDLVFPDRISRFTGEKVASRLCFSCEAEEADETGGPEKGRILAFGILPVKNVTVASFPKKELIPGGELFGVRMEIRGLMVTGTGKVEGTEISPAADAGILPGDRIVRADGAEMRGAAAFTRVMAKSGGKTVTLVLERDDGETEVYLTPVKDPSGVYRAGLWVREAAAGIGTVTFRDPETGVIAGLGHGVCDGATGKIYPLFEGSICAARPDGVRKATRAQPGEIRGSLLRGETGVILANTPTGVYAALKDGAAFPEEKAVPVALRDEVRPGEATILCQLDGEGKRAFTAQIEEICDREGETKNFVIRVTDRALLDKTGGVIQGMSGSPVLQNGKLVGAVTHVLLRSPERGYGIFIENMLATAEAVKEGEKAA